MLQRSSISTTPQIAILPYATLSGHIFEETAERGLVFKSKNIGNFFSTFVAVKQKAFGFRFHPFVDYPEWRRQFTG